MVYERAQLPIAEGRERDFEQGIQARGLELLRSAAGCQSAVLAAGVEEPNTYLLLITWDSVEAHQAWTTTADFDEFRGLIGPFVTGAPAVLHFRPVA